VPVDDPLIADDVDVIEKEWVDKAKKIVNATKENPYEQEKEVSKLQADYLMKRYNKQIKLSE
jgi:Txe/YoeB family toxin of Txe-Axe toxin-antitoxin module